MCMLIEYCCSTRMQCFTLQVNDKLVRIQLCLDCGTSHAVEVVD